MERKCSNIAELCPRQSRHSVAFTLIRCHLTTMQFIRMSGHYQNVRYWHKADMD
jgi:hypothetical protein